jgi:hypothetical protein
VPAGITQYVLQGGPCDGNTGDLTPAIDDSGQITCKGGLYKRTSPVQVSGGREVFKFAGKAPTTDGGGGTPHTHSGWNDLRKSFNKHMPRDLRASHRMTSAALRSLSRARKVRL